MVETEKSIRYNRISVPVYLAQKPSKKTGLINGRNYRRMVLDYIKIKTSGAYQVEIIRENGRYYVHVTIEEETPQAYGACTGAIGVDTNPDGLGIAHADYLGQFKESLWLPRRDQLALILNASPLKERHFCGQKKFEGAYSMRIGITGAHGVGKTSLAKELSRRLNLPLIAEQARVMADKLGIKTSEEMLEDKNIAREYQVTVLLAQVGMEDAFPRGFVSGRTTMDCLAYWRLYGLDESDEVGETYAQVCLAQQYDLLVYIPPEAPAENDGFRLTGLQKEVDDIIRQIIEVMRPTAVVSVSGSAEERVKAVINAITKKGVRPVGPEDRVARNVAAQG